MCMMVAGMGMKNVIAKRNAFAWRRPVSWLAAFALVFHSMLIGLAGVPAVAAPGGEEAAFEICHGSADADRSAPDHHPAGESHCKGCVAGGAAFVPHPPAVVPFAFIVSHQIAGGAASDLPPPSEIYREQARGPPSQA
jgi:hypothetical protein